MTQRGAAAKRAREARARTARNAKKARQSKQESSMATRTESLRRGRNVRRAVMGLEKDSLVQPRAEGERHQDTPTGGVDLGNFSRLSPTSRGSSTPIRRVEPSTPIRRVEPSTPIRRVEPSTPIHRVEPSTPIHRVEPSTPIHRVEPKRVTTFRSGGHHSLPPTTALVQPVNPVTAAAIALKPDEPSSTTWTSPPMPSMEDVEGGNYEKEEEKSLSMDTPLGLSSFMNINKSWSHPSKGRVKTKTKSKPKPRLPRARYQSRTQKQTNSKKQTKTKAVKAVRFAGKADRMPSSAVLRHLISTRLGKDYLLVNLRRTTLRHKSLGDKPRRTCRLHLLAKHRSSGTLKAYRGIWDLEEGKVSLTPLTPLKLKSPKGWTRLHSSRKGWSSYRLVD